MILEVSNKGVLDSPHLPLSISKLSIIYLKSSELCKKCQSYEKTDKITTMTDGCYRRQSIVWLNSASIVLDVKSSS